MTNKFKLGENVVFDPASVRAGLPFKCRKYSDDVETGG
jgi:hypothetical protein